MRYFKVILLLIISMQLQCCKKSTFHFFSLDKSRCITVINYGDLRYIINGNYEYVPKDSYAVLDISGIDTLGDVIGVCWDNDNMSWEMVVPNSIIVENNLNDVKFSIHTQFPKDERGLPTGDKYAQENCFGFDFYSEKLVPKESAIVK